MGLVQQAAVGILICLLCPGLARIIDRQIQDQIDPTDHIQRTDEIYPNIYNIEDLRHSRKTILDSGDWIMSAEDNQGITHSYVSHVEPGSLPYQLGLRDNDELLTYDSITLRGKGSAMAISVFDEVMYFTPFEMCYSNQVRDRDGSMLTNTSCVMAEIRRSPGFLNAMIRPDSVEEPGRPDSIEDNRYMHRSRAGPRNDDTYAEPEGAQTNRLRASDHIVIFYHCWSTDTNGFVRKPSLPVNIQHYPPSPLHTFRRICSTSTTTLTACTGRYSWDQTTVLDLSTYTQKLTFTLPRTDMAIQAEIPYPQLNDHDEHKYFIRHTISGARKIYALEAESNAGYYVTIDANDDVEMVTKPAWQSLSQSEELLFRIFFDLDQNAAGQYICPDDWN